MAKPLPRASKRSASKPLVADKPRGAHSQSLPSRHGKLLTIFVPSHNRASQLEAALESIRVAIDRADAYSDVEVLVVDDFSTELIEEVIKRRRACGDEIRYKLHDEPRGVAEIAMLHCLADVTTKFAWCVGNDDVLLPDALVHLLPILRTSKSGFHLLNLFGARDSSRSYDYFSCVDNVLTLATGKEFFKNFGFVSATTTFPCLCFEVAPLKKLALDSLTDISPIYSHTAAFFWAFHDSPCSFISRPLVMFNHNEELAEHAKLTKKNLKRRRVALYHACVGLARHLDHLSHVTGVPIEELATAREDELRKDNNTVKPSLTGFFILAFAIQQFRQEIDYLQDPSAASVYLTIEEVEYLQQFFRRTGIQDLASLFVEARRIYCDFNASSGAKRARLQELYLRVADIEAAYLSHLDDHHTIVAHIVYGQQSGIKLVHKNAARHNQRDALEFDIGRSLTKRTAARSTTMVIGCTPSALPAHHRTKLAGIAATTPADLVVFNNFTTSEKFFALFGGNDGRAPESPRELTTWTRDDMGVLELESRLQTRHGDFRIGALLKRDLSQGFGGATQRAAKPLVQFINWKTRA